MGWGTVEHSVEYWSQILNLRCILHGILYLWSSLRSTFFFFFFFLQIFVDAFVFFSHFILFLFLYPDDSFFFEHLI